MRLSPSILLVSLAVAVAATSIACSGEDAGSMHGAVWRPGPTGDTNATEPAGDSDPAAGDQGGEADAASMVEGGGAGGGGRDAGDGASGPFAGAPAYAATLGPSARKSAHPFTDGNPAGHACFKCHDAAGGATPMAFGGTVYAAGATTPAARVEIRVKDSAGKALSAWSDDDGNFYFLLNPNGDLVFPAHVGARDTNGTKLMSGTLANGNCNGCHNAKNAAGRLVAP